MSQTLYTQSALRDRIRVELLKRKWSDIIESLRPNGTITINVLKEPFLQIYCDHSEKGHFVDNIRVEVLAILKDR